jgi:hypothetical protein
MLLLEPIDTPPSNMTNEELFRLTGTLTAARIETLLDMGAKADRLSSCADCLVEARSQYPDEDFLQAVISDIQYLASKIRGGNKDFANQCADKLLQIQQEIAQNGEYGTEQLNKALRVIDS